MGRGTLVGRGAAITKEFDMKFILQTEASECGLACLAMIASHYGDHQDLPELRRRFSISLKGVTLAQLVRHASAMSLSARPLRLELEELDQLQLPCILHWNLNHFVILKSCRKRLNGQIVFVIFDPAVGERKLTSMELSNQFTGVALELTPTPEFQTSKPKPSLSLKEITGKVIGLRRALLQLFLLSVTLEIFAFAAPLFNQYVVDEVIVSGDVELLTILALGFFLLLVAQTAIDLARNWFLMRWTINIGLQWTNRVFAHLTRLPVSYFEKRHLGDIVSRFSSISAIQGTLTGVLVAGFLDGIMALVALVMMMMYSGILTSIVIANVMFYAVLRYVFYKPLRDASEERLILASRESSHFMETIRGIVAIKLFGREAERQTRWQNMQNDVVNRDVKTQKLGVLFQVTSTAVSGVQGLAMFYLGAKMVMQNNLTIGMLFAFSSYSSTFTGRVISLIDMFIGIRMLGLHSERLSDIVLEKIDSDEVGTHNLVDLSPEITLIDVRFRYAEGEPWILDGLNLTIKPGESVAIVGGSGCGKSTLCKLILGLIQPTEGEIKFGGIPLAQVGIKSYRELVGSVMQDDVLLAGSIQENIAFFDSEIDLDWSKTCAQVASIHDEISAMPMGYQSLVGEMGSSLSGGQKQRILLARALYKRPSVLVLDEATSHLDLRNETFVNFGLARLNITRIMIAHRPETINAAERIIELSSGRVTDEKMM